MYFSDSQIWEGFSYSKVFKDQQADPFPDKCAKYAAYYFNHFIGYADTAKGAERLFLEHRGFAKKADK